METATRRHDLPPRWDGCLVEWRGWEPELQVIMCPPQPPECCSGCGSLARPVVNVGSMARSPRITSEDLARDAENRRRLGSLAYKRPLLAWMRLRAFRCPDCKRDTVWDTLSDEWWDLDDTDYGHEGSVDPA